MSRRLKILLPVLTLILSGVGLLVWYESNYTRSELYGFSYGEVVDSLNGVPVYYNGGVANVSGRHQAQDGYNYGLKYQCVEFVKRYYHLHLNHKMPDTYGHAKDFYSHSVQSGQVNSRRGLLQYANGSVSSPMPDDLVVMGPAMFNTYGHVAIVSRVDEDRVEIVQQNSGPVGTSREYLPLEIAEGRYYIRDANVMGWLRKAGNDLTGKTTQ